MIDIMIAQQGELCPRGPSGERRENRDGTFSRRLPLQSLERRGTSKRGSGRMMTNI
jgi:hypothetical protein